MAAALHRAEVARREAEAQHRLERSKLKEQVERMRQQMEVMQATSRRNQQRTQLPPAEGNQEQGSGSAASNGSHDKQKQAALPPEVCTDKSNSKSAAWARGDAVAAGTVALPEGSGHNGTHFFIRFVRLRLVTS